MSENNDKIDDAIDRWHEDDSDTRPLHEALGLTRDEYAKWLARRDAGLIAAQSQIRVQQSMLDEYQRDLAAANAKIVELQSCLTIEPDARSSIHRIALSMVNRLDYLESLGPAMAGLTQDELVGNLASILKQLGLDLPPPRKIEDGHWAWGSLRFEFGAFSNDGDIR